MLSGMARRENGSGPGGWTSVSIEGTKGTLPDGRRIRTRPVPATDGWELIEDTAPAPASASVSTPEDRADRAARAGADVDDGGPDWRSMGGAAVRRMLAGLPSEEEDHRAELADRQAQAAALAAVAPAVGVPAVVAPQEANTPVAIAPAADAALRYFIAAPAAGQPLQAYDPSRRPPTTLPATDVRPENAGRMAANQLWDAIDDRPGSDEAFYRRIGEAQRARTLIPNTIRGGFRDRQRHYAGLIARGQELIGLDDRLARFRPVVAGTPVVPDPSPAVTVAPLPPVPVAPSAPPVPVAPHPQQPMIEAVRGVRAATLAGRAFAGAATDTTDPEYLRRLGELRGHYHAAVAVARRLTPGFTATDETTWGIDPDLAKAVRAGWRKLAKEGQGPFGDPSSGFDRSRYPVPADLDPPDYLPDDTAVNRANDPFRMYEDYGSGTPGAAPSSAGAASGATAGRDRVAHEARDSTGKWTSGASRLSGQSAPAARTRRMWVPNTPERRETTAAFVSRLEAERARNQVRRASRVTGPDPVMPVRPSAAQCPP